MWVAMVVVCVLGVQQSWDRRGLPGRLNRVSAGERVPTRLSGSKHRFEQLGIQVDLPLGWSYLSVEPEDRATSPTFVHQASACVVRLVGAASVQKLANFSRQDDDSGEPSLEWLVPPRDRGPSDAAEPFSTSVEETSPNEVGPATIRAPITRDPRILGHWKSGECEVGIILLTHPPGRIEDPAVASLCESIAPLVTGN